MIEISNTNVVNVPLPNLSTLIQKNLGNTSMSINVKIPMNQSSFTFESLASLLPKNLITEDYTKYLVVTNLTFESSNTINNIDLRWGKYETTISNPNHESTVTVPLTCWFSPNELTFTGKYFNFFFQEQSSLPEFINCTIQLVKLSSKWFDFFIVNGGICNLNDKYFISNEGIISKPYLDPPVINSSIKKRIYVSPIDDEYKIITKIWYRNPKDYNLINTLPGFISEHKEDDYLSFDQNLGDCLPFKKCYFINHDIENTFKNSEVVAYYKNYNCRYNPSEQLRKQYEEKLNDLVINFSQMIQEGNPDLIDTFNIENDLEILKKSFTGNYKEEYQQYIETKKLDLVENKTKKEVDNMVIEKVIDKVEVSDMALLTCPVQRKVTIFYSDKTVEIDTLFEPAIISMYGHLMDQATKKYLKIN